MRGYLTGVHPVLAAVLYALQQTREDLNKWTAGLTQDQLWTAAGDLAPVGFHVRHIAGSVDRLITYASGESLTSAQLETLQRETGRDLSSDELLSRLEASLCRAESIIRAADPAHFDQPRFIGRQRIPTTLAGLLIHIAEHTQRHTGAAIVTAKLARHR